MRQGDKQRVVLLNGPAGVGKTTVGRLLAQTARNGVVIHGDDLKGFVASRVAGEVETGMSYVGGAALANVFLDGGHDLVVFEFVFERSDHVECFRQAFGRDVSVELVTLWAPLDVVLQRERARVGREPLGGRVEACWHTMRDELPRLGLRVDAAVPASEVAEAVLQALNATSEARAPAETPSGP